MSGHRSGRRPSRLGASGSAFDRRLSTRRAPQGDGIKSIEAGFTMLWSALDHFRLFVIPGRSIARMPEPLKRDEFNSAHSRESGNPVKEKMATRRDAHCAAKTGSPRPRGRAEKEDAPAPT